MDQLSAMRAFVRVVQTGSFSAAGRDMHTTQTTISKKVAALENHIGVKLLTRSSRDHALTQAGAEYYETCVNLLGELDEAEARARSDVALPRGVLRITAPVAFGRLLLAPIISEFFSLYPDIQVDLLLSDKHVDLISDGIDVAIRARQLEDSTSSPGTCLTTTCWYWLHLTISSNSASPLPPMIYSNITASPTPG
ncbi:transcriptional regulator LysR family [Photobacterium aphoticum]|uniref:Transcriptional regulator LysR family n=1 Tax=Photobacterium aphoticum TaxID=754436 RepID=A0A090QL34_9GAMM|nr:transcriptional regulator LysR family [Photobacterium aphoticum]